MTAEQEKQFRESGCVSRSLIILAAIKNKPFASWDEYCQKFGHLFPYPTTQYGALFPSQIVDVTRAVGIGSHFESYRRYQEILGWHRKGCSVLIIFEIDFNLGATGVNRHCSVLEKIDDAGFSLITPSQDGKDYIGKFVAADWDIKLCHGYVLR